MTSLSAPVQAVLELFQGPLADVRFADVNAASLATSAAEVEAAASAVAELDAKLVELRQSLAERQEVLLQLAQRAVSYARVYAEHDEALTEQLARITLPRAAKPRKASNAKSADDAPASSVEAAPIESAVAPAEEASTAELEEAAPAPEFPRKTKRRLGPPGRGAAQSAPTE